MYDWLRGPCFVFVGPVYFSSLVHSFHEHSEFNCLSNIFISKLEQGQKECDRCVYAQFMLRDNMGVVKRGDFIHEITLAHKMLRNYVIFVVSWCLCTVETFKKFLKTISTDAFVVG